MSLEATERDAVSDDQDEQKVESLVPVPQKMEVIKIEEKPKEDLKVLLGRQNTEYFTGAAWPKPDDLVKPVNIITRGDGIWVIRKSPAGLFCVKLSEGKFPGFPKEDNKPFFYPWYGKIPFNLLQEILFFFKSICDESKDEVAAHIFWNPETKEYFNYVPFQKVSGASIKYDRDQELEAKNILVCEFHSHNTMPAYFSSVDDADEKNDRFFGVVGELNKMTPVISLSYVCGGKRQKIEVSHLFTEAPAEENLFPQEWRKRVTKEHGNLHGNWQGSHNAHWQNYHGRTVGPGGAFKHQGVQSDLSRGQIEQGRTPPTTQSGKTTSEIQDEIQRAVREEEEKVGKQFPAVDFLNGQDSSATREDAGSNPFFPKISAGGTFHTAEEYDEALDLLVGQIEESFLQHFAREVEMTQNEKRELFNSLIASMQDDDVATLLDVIAENNHLDLIMEQLGFPEDAPGGEGDLEVDDEDEERKAMDVGGPLFDS